MGAVSPCYQPLGGSQHDGVPKSSIPGLLRAPPIYAIFHPHLYLAVPSIPNAFPHHGCSENPIVTNLVQCPLLGEAFPDHSAPSFAPELSISFEFPTRFPTWVAANLAGVLWWVCLYVCPLMFFEARDMSYYLRVLRTNMVIFKRFSAWTSLSKRKCVSILIYNRCKENTSWLRGEAPLTVVTSEPAWDPPWDPPPPGPLQKSESP